MVKSIISLTMFNSYVSLPDSEATEIAMVDDDPWWMFHSYMELVHGVSKPMYGGVLFVMGVAPSPKSSKSLDHFWGKPR